MKIKLPETTKDRVVAAIALIVLVALASGVYQSIHTPLVDSFDKAADEAEQAADASRNPRLDPPNKQP